MSKPLQLLVETDGSFAFIHDDALAPLLDEGEARTRRASHVEPAESGRDWEADLSPVAGPTLGPFPTRRAALDAEVAWLHEHHFRLGS